MKDTTFTAKQFFSAEVLNGDLQQINDSMSCCRLCPRNCAVNRLAGKVGYCGQSAEIYAARAALHFWEEPCISGESGSGAVFFSGCNMRCIFCQNRNIATSQVGKQISLQRLSDIFLELEDKGANNINLVTPTHFIPQLVYAIESAKNHGLTIPIVYNTSSYEKVESLKLLDGLVDIYLPDFKYFSADLSKEYSQASDYFQIASQAIFEMLRQVGKPYFYKDTQLMKKGVIVRHLLLPNQSKDSKKILRFLHENFGNDIYVSIMNQYTPLSQVSSIPELNRKVTDIEYKKILKFAEDIGIENGFFQLGDTAKESFIPSFDYEGL